MERTVLVLQFPSNFFIFSFSSTRNLFWNNFYLFRLVSYATFHKIVRRQKAFVHIRAAESLRLGCFTTLYQLRGLLVSIGYGRIIGVMD
jgi:hypothetical protein